MDRFHPRRWLAATALVGACTTGLLLTAPPIAAAADSIGVGGTTLVCVGGNGVMVTTDAAVNSDGSVTQSADSQQTTC